jgi:hypothetical protein
LKTPSSFLICYLLVFARILYEYTLQLYSLIANECMTNKTPQLVRLKEAAKIFRLHARIYSGPALVTDNSDTVPITLEFEDTTGDGKLDMIVHIGDQKIVYLNDGTQFKPQQ